MLRTNFSTEEFPKYRKAIVEYVAKTGECRLTIKDEAYDCYGERMFDAMSLHDSKNENLSLFWEIFRNIEIPTKNEMLENMQYYMEYCRKHKYVTPEDWINNHKHF